MNKISTMSIAALVTALGLSTGANAAYLGTLEYVQPTATVGATDTIDVRVRLTLDPTSDALNLVNDPFGPPPYGVPVANYPSGIVAFTFFDGTNTTFHNGTLVSVDSIYLNTYFECSGTFGASCISGPPYSFNFNTSGPETINFRPTSNGDFSLAAGASYEYLFGSFTPDGGSAAPGTYTFYNTGLTLNFQGTYEETTLVLDGNGDPIPLLDGNGDPVLDGNGDPVFQTQSVLFNNATHGDNIAVTPCTGNANPGCTGAFERTVSAVPVPAAAWLTMSALGALGFARRRVA